MIRSFNFMPLLKKEFMKRIFVFAIFFVAISCKEPKKEAQQKTLLTAQEIIDKTIETAGGERYLHNKIQFTFRGKQYESERNKWQFSYKRITVDSLGNKTVDELTNKGFNRTLNDVAVQLPDSLQTKYGNSVNSVHYFAYLPYGLNDKAVNKRLLGTTTIKNEPYYKIEVTFNEEGGGEDFEDVYVYWIHKENFTADYLAYKFHVNGGGLRFREAFNPRVVNGIRFVDYNNYKPKEKNVTVYELDSLFEAGALELLSKILLENVQVSLKNTN